jgi:tetratricopeptide (TPR) repeat protein
MCCVYAFTPSLLVKLMISLWSILVPPPEPSGSFAEALRLFDQFLQQSDLDAARRCIAILESMLADFHTDVPTHHSVSASFPSDCENAGRPVGRQRRYHILIQLAHILEERHRYAGDASDLGSAARYSEEALALCHAENVVCPTVFVFYADTLAASFEVTTNSRELHIATMLCRIAAPLCVASHPLNSLICHTLSWIVFRQFEQSGDEALINEAIHLQRVGLEQLPQTELQNRHRHLRRLSQNLATKHDHLGNQDEDDMLSSMEEAFRICPPMHVDRWVLYTQMTRQLRAEYDRSGQLVILNRAIELGREGLGMGMCPRAARRAGLLNNMANCLRSRYETARTDDHDLEESMELYREALKMSLPSGPNYWVCLGNLARALTLQFRLDGDVSHLEEASQLYHQASDILSKDCIERPFIISCLAASLGLRFRETGDISELNRAIDLDTQVVAALRPLTSHYTYCTLQMVSHLCLRFEVLRGNDDLKKAITVAEELFQSLPGGYINRLSSILALAKARLLRAIDDNYSGDVDLTTQLLLSDPDELSRSSLGPESLRTLAACYVVKWRQSSDVNYTLRARDTIKEALESFSPDYYEQFQSLIDAAGLYMEHGTPYYDINVALQYLSDAVRSTRRDVRSKIQGVKRILTRLVMEHHDLFTMTSSTSFKLLDIIGNAVALLPRIAFFGIHPYSRLQSLKEGQSIAMTGASLALNLSQPERALEIMEQGRAIFWTHTLRLRSPFDGIPDELHNRLLVLARRLEKVASVSANSTDQRYMEKEIAQRRKDSEEFNSLVDQVRLLPGRERFMLPDEYSTLKGVTEKGPVVVLVCSPVACHAMIFMQSGSVFTVPLKAVTNKWLVESASTWRSTVIEARSELRDKRKMFKAKKVSDSSHTRSEQILRLLRMNVVFPIIQALHIEVRMITLHHESNDSLDDMQPSLDRDRPRIWWCPTGCFAHLPIHAAGADGKWCSDYVVSSYTPTISSLIDARKVSTPVKKQNSKALIAAVPHAFSPEWCELPSTSEEANIIKASLPEGTVISICRTNEAGDGDTTGITTGALLDKLPEATILHLACHGYQDPDNALNSGFVMSDEMLTIERLMQVSLPRAFMAFLSACETAKGDEVSTEEACNSSALTLSYTLESFRSSCTSRGNHVVCGVQERDCHPLVRIVCTMATLRSPPQLPTNL